VIDAALGEIMVTCSKMEWLMSRGKRALKPEDRSTNLLLCYKKSQVIYEPLGVVAAIVSWNYRQSLFFRRMCDACSIALPCFFPALHNAWSPILASIFAGNGIALKCSEHVIWSSTWFVGAIQECLLACGHDPDLVQASVTARNSSWGG
jgi:acyl-CoA reductase-like NAD-dependent aldehyde dehydrogenase